MQAEVEFVDLYHLLQVDPACDPRTLEKAYHYLAKLYHPDNPETHDSDRFSQVVDAYVVLRDADTRAEYDRQYFALKGLQRPESGAANLGAIDEATALGDAQLHHRILLKLYRRRRESALDAGVIGWSLQEHLGCSDEEFDFHIWYLKSRGFLALTQEGALEITIEGVDHVIATSQRTEIEQRRIAQQRGGHD